MLVKPDPLPTKDDLLERPKSKLENPSKISLLFDDSDSESEKKKKALAQMKQIYTQPPQIKRSNTHLPSNPTTKSKITASLFDDEDEDDNNTFLKKSSSPNLSPKTTNEKKESPQKKEEVIKIVPIEEAQKKDDNKTEGGVLEERNMKNIRQEEGEKKEAGVDDGLVGKNGGFSETFEVKKNSSPINSNLFVNDPLGKKSSEPTNNLDNPLGKKSEPTKSKINMNFDETRVDPLFTKKVEPPKPKQNYDFDEPKDSFSFRKTEPVTEELKDPVTIEKKKEVEPITKSEEKKEINTNNNTNKPSLVPALKKTWNFEEDNESLGFPKKESTTRTEEKKEPSRISTKKTVNFDEPSEEPIVKKNIEPKLEPKPEKTEPIHNPLSTRASMKEKQPDEDFLNNRPSKSKSNTLQINSKLLVFLKFPSSFF